MDGSTPCDDSSVSRPRARKLRKLLRKRGVEADRLLAICTGTKCAPRTLSRPLVEYARDKVTLVTVGCLHVCKKGPIAATVRGKKVRIKKRVDLAKLSRMIEKVAGAPQMPATPPGDGTDCGARPG
jgi:hypothetical protein